MRSYGSSTPKKPRILQHFSREWMEESGFNHGRTQLRRHEIYVYCATTGKIYSVKWISGISLIKGQHGKKKKRSG
ncbi:hypothetical protein evm_005029 [Chilo suppressalis]|nr:hypothetical protein evm_005029 [Chilo suppressalis]